VYENKKLFIVFIKKNNKNKNNNNISLKFQKKIRTAKLYFMLPNIYLKSKKLK